MKALHVSASYEDLERRVRAIPAASALSVSAIRTVIVAGTIAVSYAQTPTPDIAFTHAMFTVDWLAGQALYDEGLTTEEAQAPIFEAVDAMFSNIVNETRKRVDTPDPTAN